jgi:hypothetical protein
MPESFAMAKKKLPKPGPQRLEMVAFRCTPSFKTHLEEIAESETRTPTQVIERALEAYARAGGYEPFPKR